MSAAGQSPPGRQALVRNESLRRGLLVLRALAGAGAPITAAELARQTGIPGPTVARLLVTLEDEGMAARDAGGGWRPGAGIAELAGAAGELATLVAGAGTVLRTLANKTGETALLSRVLLPDVSEVLVQEDADRLLGATDWVGRTFDAHRSVAGWVVAAELDDDDVAEMGARGPRDARALGGRCRRDEIAGLRRRRRRPGSGPDLDRSCRAGRPRAGGRDGRALGATDTEARGNDDPTTPEGGRCARDAH